MKQKLLLTLVALFSVMGGVKAGEPDWNGTSVQSKISTTEIVEGDFQTPTYYQLIPKNHATQCIDASSKNANNFLTLATTTSSNSTQWVIVGNSSDGYRFVNRETKTDLLLKTEGLSGQESNNNLPINPAFQIGTANENYTNTFDIVEAAGSNDGYFVISMHGNNNYVWNDNNGALAGWYSAAGYGYYGWNRNESNASGDTGSMFKIEQVNFDNVSIEVNFQKDGVTLLTKNIELPTNNNDWLNFIVVDEVAYYTLSSEVAQITSETRSVIVNITPNFPFQTSKFYQIKNVNQNYVKYDDENTLSDKNTSNNTNPNQLWYFVPVENTLNKFTIHSIVDGKAWTGTSGKVSMSDNGTEYQILKNGTQFNIFTGNDHGYVGAHQSIGGEANAAVGFWGNASASENGSKWTITEFDETIINTTIKSLYAHDAYTGNIVGNVDNHAEGHTAYNNYVNSKTADNLNAILTAYNNGTIVGIDANKFYTIRENVRPANPNYMTANPNANTAGQAIDSNRNLYCQSTSGNDYSAVKCLWQFELADDGQYYIKNVNSGLYIGQATHNSQMYLPLDKQYAGKYTLAHYSQDYTKIGFKYNNGGVHLNTNSQLSRVDGWANNSTVENSDGNRWTIAEVTEIPVTIDEDRYSTYCFPMNVQKPEGVEVYLVNTKDETHVQLAEYNGSIIPAGTGVVLKNTGTHNFTITTDEADGDVSANILAGATIRRQGFEANANYVLANKSNGMGFYKSGSITAIPANKAYIPATNLSNGAAMLTFDFDEEIETAIKELEAEKLANSKIYDVQGRLVKNPTKGLYIVNGKKVMFK